MALCKGQRSTYVNDMGNRSVEECLPAEMLEAILGKLDRETLCTARLVSRTFCAAASVNISSLTVRSPSQAVSLERFPCLGRVRVHHVGDNASLAELDPRLRAVITHLTVSEGDDDVSMALPGLPDMAMLRELDLEAHAGLDGGAALHHLTNLQVFRIGWCTPPVAMTIITMTQLTSLAIGPVTWSGKWSESAETSWLQHATILRNLQALEIAISQEALPLVGNLTGLTGLTWLGYQRLNWGIEGTHSMASLTCLRRLRSLDIAPSLLESALAIACSLGSGSLANLCLGVTWDVSADCGRHLARQTALTRLVVRGEQLCNLRHMRVELLQSLELQRLDSVDAEGLEALLKATRLTRLNIKTLIELPDRGLSQALGQLTQLRALRLDLYGNGVDTTPRLALSRLMALTELQICMCIGEREQCRLDNGDLRALLGLTNLQVLHLHCCSLTDDVVPGLAGLTNLRTLEVNHSGVRSLAAATSILNPLREARGWPPMHARCQ